VLSETYDTLYTLGISRKEAYYVSHHDGIDYFDTVLLSYARKLL